MASTLISKNMRSYSINQSGKGNGAGGGVPTGRKFGPYRPLGIKAYVPEVKPFKLSEASKHIYKELRGGGKKNRE